MPRGIILSTQYLDERNEEDQTRLMVRANDGNYYYLQRLLLLGADPNKRTFAGKTALELVFKKLLINKGRVGKSYLVNKYLDSIRVLSQSPNINLEMFFSNGHTALTYAIYFNLTDIVKMLLETGADPNTKIYKYISSEQSALGTVLTKLTSNYEEPAKQSMINMILSAEKFDPNVKIIADRTPLRIFAAYGRPGLIRKLIDLGADVNIGNKEISMFEIAATPLGGAVLTAIKNPQASEYFEVVVALLEADEIELDAITLNGMTALELAQRNNRQDIVDIIEGRRTKSH